MGGGSGVSGMGALSVAALLVAAASTQAASPAAYFPVVPYWDPPPSPNSPTPNPSCDGHYGTPGTDFQPFTNNEGQARIAFTRSVERGPLHNRFEQICVGAPSLMSNDSFYGVVCSGNFTRDGLSKERNGLPLMHILPETTQRGPVALILAVLGPQNNQGAHVCSFLLYQLGKAMECLDLNTSPQGALQMADDGSAYATFGQSGLVVGGYPIRQAKKILTGLNDQSMAAWGRGTDRVWFISSSSNTNRPNTLCSAAFKDVVNYTRQGVTCNTTTFIPPHRKTWALGVANGSVIVPVGHGQLRDCKERMPCNILCAYEPATGKKGCTDPKHMINAAYLSNDGQRVLMGMGEQICLVSFSLILKGKADYSNCVRASIWSGVYETSYSTMAWEGGTVSYIDLPTGRPSQLCVAKEGDLSGAVCSEFSPSYFPIVRMDPSGRFVSWTQLDQNEELPRICTAGTTELLSGGSLKELAVCAC